MLYKVTTNQAVTAAAASLQTAVEANHFGVMQVHNLQETMIKKGVKFAHPCLIYEVCQPQQAKKVLEENMSVSTALPCRISIYEEDGKTMLATLKPTVMLAMFKLTSARPRRTGNPATTSSCRRPAPAASRRSGWSNPTPMPMRSIGS